jgi:hypothetical protein
MTIDPNRRTRGFYPVPTYALIGHQMGAGYLFGPLWFGTDYSWTNGLTSAGWVLLGIVALWLDRSKRSPRGGAA